LPVYPPAIDKKEKRLKSLLKRASKKTPLYQPLKKWREARIQEEEIREWERKGKPVPPPHIIKQRTLRFFAKKFNLKILVETGTYYGDMVEAMKGVFERIHSIELSEELYEKAKKRFEGEEKIHLIHGDSGIEIGKLIGSINQPALFWLDGHYSAGVTARGEKDTPIRDELTHILNAQNREHVIIIDDARMFGVNPAYPSMEELSKLIRAKRPDCIITVKDDSIRITPDNLRR
jgi:hypothetical protein